MFRRWGTHKSGVPKDGRDVCARSNPNSKLEPQAFGAQGARKLFAPEGAEESRFQDVVTDVFAKRPRGEPSKPPLFCGWT